MERLWESAFFPQQVNEAAVKGVEKELEGCEGCETMEYSDM